MDFVKESFLTAVGFTFLMISLGVLIGLQMDDFRGDHLSDELRQSQLDSETFSVIESYSGASGNNYCGLLEVQIPEIGERNAELGSRLERFDAQSLGDDSEYVYIRDRYYNNQLRLYMALESYQNDCSDNQTRILYFFDDSSNSERQGAVLDEVVEDKGVQVFSFNVKADSPVVQVLVQNYNITEQPTLIINGETKLEGFISRGELLNDVIDNS